ncbi:rRNA-processing protein cgr1 [Scheffersomyces spartinae]|uniref:rRNA-processing protein n=1 Tax=Scheffersomyces spartinae TaxID=45513 RepID=A0A9P8AJB0_9ASCO|nr:rRNA-processing protein cgr1 [Scheffersomyces spartinae]KAG7195268.1 rRNA-processing protein cgr1 [Scheffersomyces spartinae]
MSAKKPVEDIPKKFIDPVASKDADEGDRVNGKNWKMKKDAFRVKSLGVSKTLFSKRQENKLLEEQYKARIADLKQEKNDAKQAHINELKRRREIKAEKERYEMMATKMHAKKVERMRRREKRNKMLKER